MRITLSFFLFSFLIFSSCISSKDWEEANNHSDTIETVNNIKSEYNPCKDTLYQRLKKISIESLSEREYQYFLAKDKECGDYNKVIIQTEPQNKIANKEDNTLEIVLGVIGGIATLWLILAIIGNASK